jgi:uncharacterized protein (TIGR02996 family)
VARFVRDDDVVDVWIDGSQVCTQLNRDPVQLVGDSKWANPRAYRRLLSARLQTGWRRVRDPKRELDTDEPIEPALEAALAADPDSAAAALVYADWYQEQGHPRGDLITVQHARASRPDDAALVAHEDELFAEWDEYVNPAPYLHDPDALELAWRNGFIRSARLGRSDDHSDQVLWDLLRSPSARFLRELVVGVQEYGDQDNRLMTDLVVRGGHYPPLRKLYIADLDDTRYDGIDLSRAPVGDFTGVGARYPFLEELLIKGTGDVVLGALDLPRLRRFALRTSSLQRAALRSVVAASWPALEELELWFGSTDYGADTTADDVAPLLATTASAPDLRTLRLMNSDHSDDLAALVATSPRAATLETLDFSLGTLGGKGAAALLAAHRRGAFPALERIYVHDCCLRPGDLTALRASGLRVIEQASSFHGGRIQSKYDREHGQKLHRFVTVSE